MKLPKKKRWRRSMRQRGEVRPEKYKGFCELKDRLRSLKDAE